MLNKKFSVLMMVLLIATAASLLVGISSNVTYKPVYVQAQEKPSQQQVQKQQQQKQRLQLPPPIGAQQTQKGQSAATTSQSPESSDVMTNLFNYNKKALRDAREDTRSSIQSQQQQQQPSKASQVLQPRTSIGQYVQDTELVDRIFPLIIQKIDGRTLAQKIDVATLLQKIDAQTLAAKVLPYIQVVVPVRDVYGPLLKVSKSGFAPDTFERTSAKCPTGDTAVGGGLLITTQAGGNGDNGIASLAPRASIVDGLAKMGKSGEIMAVAKCLRPEAIVSLKP
jgi:hypothetical protein